MTCVRASVIGVSAAIAMLAATTASAASYDFTLLDNNGTTIDASGVITLTGDVIDAISGEVTGYGAITGLITNPNSPGPNILGDILYDNLFDPSVPGVDNYGIFLSTASGANFNLFNLDSWGANIPDNTATLYNDTAGAYVANGTFSISPATAAVPEAAAWTLMLVGIGFAGASLRTSRRRSIANARLGS
jgi:hypothetical protein